MIGKILLLKGFKRENKLMPWINPINELFKNKSIKFTNLWMNNKKLKRKIKHQSVKIRREIVHKKKIIN